MLGKKEIREILQSRFKDDLHTKISQIPRPEALKDVYKAAQRIKKALQMGEKIVIVGDFKRFFKKTRRKFVRENPKSFYRWLRAKYTNHHRSLHGRSNHHR